MGGTSFLSGRVPGGSRPDTSHCEVSVSLLSFLFTKVSVMMNSVGTSDLVYGQDGQRGMVFETFQSPGKYPDKEG